MTALRKLQIQFREAMTGEDHDAMAARLAAFNMPPSRSLGIYRNNIFTNLREALRALFPVIERLVGTEFFDYAANAYIRSVPSPAGDLNQFGARFGDFLIGFEPAASLPYLPDTARLEWLTHRAYHAADAIPLRLERLRTVPPKRYGELHFHLHPAAGLLASPYPVQRIWQVNQPGYVGDQAVELDSGPVRLLIERRNGRIEVRTLAAAEDVLLRALARGDDFATACEQAVVTQPDFELGAALTRLTDDATLVDFTLRRLTTDNNRQRGT